MSSAPGRVAKPTVFVSHAVTDGPIAAIIKAEIDRIFARRVRTLRMRRSREAATCSGSSLIRDVLMPRVLELGNDPRLSWLRRRPGRDAANRGTIGSKEMPGRVTLTFTLAAVAVALVGATVSKAGSGVSPKLGSCPRGALALSPQDLKSAERVVFRYATGKWARKAGMRIRGAHVTAVRMAPRWLKGGFVKKQCGATTWRRTVVVSVLYPAEFYAHGDDPGPCSSCAGAEFLASRTRQGWLIWYVL
jgi:hypothetical protein